MSLTIYKNQFLYTLDCDQIPDLIQSIVNEPNHALLSCRHARPCSLPIR